MVRLASMVVVLAAAGVLVWLAGPDVDGIRAWVEGFGWWAPVAFVLAYAVLVVALVPGAALTLAAGLVFGAVGGTLLTLMGAILGATAAFWLARAAGRRAVERLAAGPVARVDGWLGEHGLMAVITLRLVPLVPFSLSNWAAGVTAIRPRHFVVGTMVGIVPGTIVYATLGSRATEPTSPVFAGALAGLGLLVLLGMWLVRRHHRRVSPRHGQ